MLKKSFCFYLFICILNIFCFCLIGIGKVMANVANTDVEMQVTIDEIMVLDCDENINFEKAILPGEPQISQGNCTIETNSESGFKLEAKRFSSPTLSAINDDSIGIPDLPDWSAANPNAVVWTPQTKGLGFRVNKKNTNFDQAYEKYWWGSTDNVANAKFSGIPEKYITILQYDRLVSKDINVGIDYKLDVSESQYSGQYTGKISYRLTANP